MENINTNHAEIFAEFCRIRSVAPDWTPALLRESVIDTFSFKWGMAKDEVTEIVDSYSSFETETKALKHAEDCGVVVTPNGAAPDIPKPRGLRP